MENGLGRYWDDIADHAFAHRIYNHHLISAQKVVERWNQTWLHNFSRRHPLEGKHIVDYGIGGGLLGVVLLRDYRVGYYTGIDVSNASIESTRKRLKFTKEAPWTKWTLKHTPIRFASLGPPAPDVFVSQAVIQHFPTRSYTDAFFSNLEASRIPIIVLQIKVATLNGGKQPEFADGGNHRYQIGEFVDRASGRLNFTSSSSIVAEATRLPLKYVLDALPSYKLQWHCECVGKWRCHEDIAVQAATGPPMLHQPHPPTEFTKEWMWLVVKGKLAGEAILELGLR